MNYELGVFLLYEMKRGKKKEKRGLRWQISDFSLI